MSLNLFIVCLASVYDSMPLLQKKKRCKSAWKEHKSQMIVSRMLQTICELIDDNTFVIYDLIDCWLSSDWLIGTCCVKNIYD